MGDYAQADERRIDVCVDRGHSAAQNVGAGFQLVTQQDTELHIYLYSNEGTIVKSDMVSWASDTKWSKVSESETHWRGILASGTSGEGIGPNHHFWCVIRCTMVYDTEGEGPVYRWMSVSDVDLDADTDNDNLGTSHRPPSRSESEDYHEYPGVLSEEIVGLIVPVNDNNDVAWHTRDGNSPMNRTLDADVLDFGLEICPKRDGQWITTFPNLLRYMADGTQESAADRDLAKDEHVVLDLHLESAWEAITGLDYTGYGFYYLNEPSAGYVPRDAISYLFLGCDIDVDSDNNGVIDASNSSSSGEDFLEAHPSDNNLYEVYPQFKYGLIVWPNDDDDNVDRYPDNGFVGPDIWSNDNAFTVEGDDDLEDLGLGTLRGLGLVYEPLEEVIYSDLTPVLRLYKVSGDGAIRLFLQEQVDGQWQYTRVNEFIYDGDDVAVVGFGDPSVENWKRFHCTGGDIRVEGLQSGVVMLAYELLLAGSVLHRDEVRITVAPFILLPNTQPAEEVYVSDADPSFAQAVTSALANESCTVVTVPESQYNSVWLQDQVEIGYYQRPMYQSQPEAAVRHVALELPRGSDLHLWASEQFLQKDFGLSGAGTDHVPENWGGNVEVTPPVTVDGTHYKMGRIVVGLDMEPPLKDFFERQAVQSPVIELDVGWLGVGHVDEVISFVPDGSSGFKVLIADTDCAIELLNELNRQDEGTATDAGATTLTDGVKNWSANDGGEWKDGFVEITAGTGAGQVRQIQSNTATTVTVKTAWTTVPGTDSEYQLVARSAYRCMFTEGDEDLGVAETATATTLVDGTKNWPAGKWVDGYVAISEGTGRGQIKRVVASTGTQLTVAPWETGRIPDATSRYSVVQMSKMSRDRNGNLYSALMTVRFLLTCQQWLTYNASCQTCIGSIRATLAGTLQLSDAAFVEIPALFRWDEENGLARAYVPNMANCLVSGGTLVTAKPFGPRSGTEDLFETYVKGQLGGLNVQFIDSWDCYHVWQGGVHCGTNATRTPPDVTWWE